MAILGSLLTSYQLMAIASFPDPTLQGEWLAALCDAARLARRHSEGPPGLQDYEWSSESAIPAAVCSLVRHLSFRAIYIG